LLITGGSTLHISVHSSLLFLFQRTRLSQLMYTAFPWVYGIHQFSIFLLFVTMLRTST
jgi:hypothetical protein